MVKKRADAATERIKKLLIEKYLSAHPDAAIDVYRYNPVSIRIRIIDPAFEGKSIPQRERAVWAVLKQLPDEVQADISVCLLLTPQEQASSLMNLEFEQPSHSRF